MEPILACHGLRKSFGDIDAVRDVSFEVVAGQTYGLLGPNGAGKTTSISMACGLLQPDGGQITVAGLAMTTRSTAAKARIGYVPQELAVYPDLSARENLEFFGRLYAMEATRLRSRVDDVLELVGLRERAADRAEEYSGGMKRRLNIGIGLLHEPAVLVLDEPTVGVDPQSRNAILEAVERLSHAGTAVLYTTHYMEEAQRLCDRVGIIDGGRLLAEGTRRELVALVGGEDRVVLTASGDLEGAAAAARQLDAVGTVSVAESGIELTVSGAGSLLPELLRTAADAGTVVSGVQVVEPDLEGVFLHLTGKALRD